MTKTGLSEVVGDDLGFGLVETPTGLLYRVRLSKLQNISVTFGETPLPFLPFGLFIKCLEVSPEGEDHDDDQPIGYHTNTVRVSVSLTQALGQMYEPATLIS
jgi:hypothetical protein